MIHGERLVDDTPHVRVSLADVELPNHVRFTQYVFRMRRCAMTVVLDDAGERVLLMRRHRFIVDRWVWELPGGYVDDDGERLCDGGGARGRRGNGLASAQDRAGT
jgi:8-oxo-dGTP pyrophosphatase MutT (NUDIX family)